MATEGNLARHHVPCSPRCFICGHALADTAHVFFFCPAVRPIWKRYSLWLYVKSFNTLNVQEILEALCDLKILSLEEIIMVCWGFWKERCDSKHGKGGLGVGTFSADWALHYQHDFAAAQTNLTMTLHAPGVSGWRLHRQCNEGGREF